MNKESVSTNIKKIKEMLKDLELINFCLNKNSSIEDAEFVKFDELLKNFGKVIFDINYIIIKIRPCNNDKKKIELYQSLFCCKNTYGDYFKISDSLKITNRIITSINEEKTSMIYEISKIYANFINESDDSHNSVELNEFNLDEIANLDVEDYSPHVLLNDYIIERRNNYKNKLNLYKDEFYLLIHSLIIYFDKNMKQINDLL